MASNAARFSNQDKAYYILSGIFLSLFLLSIAYPLLYVVSSSFSSGKAVSSGRVLLFPVEFSLDGYKAVFRKPDIILAYINTILYSLVGTCINVTMAIITAYPLSRSDLRGRNVIMFFFAFTMFFSGGIIPNYILIKYLGLMDSFGSMVIPGALSVYNMIIVRTFFQGIPKELYEAAALEGASDLHYFSRIILPLSNAVIAVIALYSVVGHWNAYFNALLYLNTRAKLPLQIILREILIMSQIDLSRVTDPELMLSMMDLADVLKYAIIIIATLPILCVYPFAQKYFVRGIMIGSIKG